MAGSWRGVEPACLLALLGAGTISASKSPRAQPGLPGSHPELAQAKKQGPPHPHLAAAGKKLGSSSTTRLSEGGELGGEPGVPWAVPWARLASEGGGPPQKDTEPGQREPSETQAEDGLQDNWVLNHRECESWGAGRSPCLLSTCPRPVAVGACLPPSLTYPALSPPAFSLPARRILLTGSHPLQHPLPPRRPPRDPNRQDHLPPAMAFRSSNARCQQGSPPKRRAYLSLTPPPCPASGFPWDSHRGTGGGLPRRQNV